MSEAIEVRETHTDVQISTAPKVVLSQAKEAAEALTGVLRDKKKPVVFNGEQYLEFEDWQTLGRFYQVTAKVVETSHIEIEGVHGFSARAVALRSDGIEISAAESMCMRDEPNWVSKPLFQLRSMAQTRACAKALRNVLAWVVVLAGYKPTPAEEMDGIFNQTTEKAPRKTPKAKKKEGVSEDSGEVVVGMVEHVAKKEGKKKDGTSYCRYGIKVDGTYYNTFNGTFGALAEDAMELDHEVKIVFNNGDYGKDIVSLEVDGVSSDPTDEPTDDAPF